VLSEIPRTRQITGEPRRRWFTDEAMDLTVWYSDRDEIAGFQLAYGKPQEEKAITWHPATGVFHTAVDDGEGRPGKYKGTPILVPDGALDAWSVCGEFRRRARAIDAEVRDFVCTRLVQCRGNAEPD